MVHTINNVVIDDDFMIYSCNSCGEMFIHNAWKCTTCDIFYCENCYPPFSTYIFPSGFSHRGHNFVKQLYFHYYEICSMCKTILSGNSDKWYSGSLNWSNYDYEYKQCCFNCSLTSRGERWVNDTISKFYLIDSQKGELWSKTCFGSVNDWKPIIKDVEGNMILFNRNADLPISYACMSVDQSGKCSIYTLAEEWTIEKIIEKLVEYTSSELEAPIKQFMRSLGMYDLVECVFTKYCYTHM